MSLPLVVLAEYTKLTARRSARLGWAVALLVGLLPGLALIGWRQAGLAVLGMEVDELLRFDGAQPLIGTFYLRNFFIHPTFLVVLGAQSMAGEIADRTLRESLLRPVARHHVLLAKLAALVGWDILATAIMSLAAATLGVLAFGLHGDWYPMLLGIGLNLLSDTMLLTLVLAMATVTRSTLLTLAGTVLWLIFDRVLGWIMALVAGGFIVKEPWVIAIARQYPVLLNACMGLWSSFLPGHHLEPRTLGATVLYGLLGLATALLVFRRADVP